MLARSIYVSMFLILIICFCTLLPTTVIHLASIKENHRTNLTFSFLQFDDILNTIFSSAPTVALIVATLLDNTLDAVHTTIDRGIPWWAPFLNRKGDLRNEEFYSLPIRIHELIPTRFLRWCASICLVICTLCVWLSGF